MNCSFYMLSWYFVYKNTFRSNFFAWQQKKCWQQFLYFCCQFVKSSEMFRFSIRCNFQVKINQRSVHREEKDVPICGDAGCALCMRLVWTMNCQGRIFLVHNDEEYFYVMKRKQHLAAACLPTIHAQHTYASGDSLCVLVYACLGNASKLAWLFM